MHLRILGFNSPYPPPGGAGPGYLLEAGSSKILLECGSGVVSRLKTYCDFRRGELDAVVISHLHPDHFADLLVLRYAHHRNMLETGVAPLPVFAPAEPALERAVLEYKSLQVTTIEAGTSTNIEGFEFTFFATDHAIPCQAMRISHAGRTLFYTADTAYDQSLVEAARGADLLMAEASFLTRDKGANVPKHMTAAECGQMASAAGVRRLLLTHFWPEYDTADLLREAQEHFDGEIIVAANLLPVKV